MNKKPVYMPLFDEIVRLESDRDKWKTCAEAVERALRLVAGDNQCNVCMNKKYIDDEICNPCCDGVSDNWQFDEARFAKGGINNGKSDI